MVLLMPDIKTKEAMDRIAEFCNKHATSKEKK